jgi:hypothetical protein
MGTHLNDRKTWDGLFGGHLDASFAIYESLKHATMPKEDSWLSLQLKWVITEPYVEIQDFEIDDSVDH